MNRPTQSPLHGAVKALCEEAAKKISKAVIESGVTEIYRNADGTYNGVALLADLAGVSEEEVRQQWAEVKKRRRQ